MAKIDWNAPLEAYHPDGRVVEVHVKDGPDEDGDYRLTDDRTGTYFYLPNGQPSPHGDGSNWRIRNRRPTASEHPEGYSPELVEIVRQYDEDGITLGQAWQKVRALVAAKADPLLIEAREIAASQLQEGFRYVSFQAGDAETCAARYREGKGDDELVSVICAALRRGLELANKDFHHG